jgi:outer membrane protein assembly factor BamD (BamD/ComL family)
MAIVTTGCGVHKARRPKKTTAPEKKKATSLRTDHIKNMTYEEAIAARDYFAKHKNIDNETAVIERLLFLTQDSHERELLMLDAANNHMKTKEYKQAQVLYDTFKNMYPGSEYLIEAIVAEIESWEKTIPSIYHDQSATIETFNRSIQVLKEYNNKLGDTGREKINKAFATAAKNLILHESAIIEQLLIKHVIYKQQETLTAAHKRYEHMYKTVIMIAAEYSPLYAELAQKIPAKIEQATIELLHNYTTIAQSAVHTPEVLSKRDIF